MLFAWQLLAAATWTWSSWQLAAAPGGLVFIGDMPLATGNPAHFW
jgi:hypothetical protein